MDVVGQALQVIGGIGILVCYILVLVQMFRRGRTGLAIACIVLFFCFGIGGLISFIVGWMNHREWGISNVMYAWTGFLILSIVGGLLHPINVQQFQQQLQAR
jgi:hypothetical protein